MNLLPNLPASGSKRSGPSKDLHRDCFACGVCNPLGLQLHFEVGEDGVAAATWSPSPEFTSYPDRVHGGIIATLLDSAMVHALFARNVTGVTVESKTRYQKPVKLPDPVRITGWVESVRHGVYLCRAEIQQERKRIVWTEAKFMAMPHEQPDTE